MDKLNFVITVSIVILFLSLFLAYFLITVKTEHKLSNRLFAVFLVLTAIDISGILFGSFVNGPSNVGMFQSSVTFLQFPTFYLYVLSVCYTDFELKPKQLLHAVPFLLTNLILLPRFYAVDMAAKISFLEQNSSMLEIRFNHLFIHVQIALYIAATFLLLRRVRKIYLENYAGASLESIHWLFQLTLALSFFYIIALIKNIFKFSAYPDISEWLKIGLFIFELLIISWYLFKALNHPSLFRKIDSKLKLLKSIISEEKKSAHLAAEVQTYDDELRKLSEYMSEQKPFLNPSLSIQNVSDSIEIPTRDLSLLINHQLGQHFFDFINTYRIEEAMAILRDETKNDVTVLEILYQVGFNSKSSFNTAFKKHTSTTPTAYRKSMINSDL
ncbi:MAG: helix-turn-helix domain-containing protein [Bacteroidia bacterium]